MIDRDGRRLIICNEDIIINFVTELSNIDYIFINVWSHDMISRECLYECSTNKIYTLFSYSVSLYDSPGINPPEGCKYAGEDLYGGIMHVYENDVGGVCTFFDISNTLENKVDIYNNINYYKEKANNIQKCINDNKEEFDKCINEVRAELILN